MSEFGFDLSYIIAALLMGLGVFFSFSAAIGLIRFPDFLSKIHALSVSDSLGVPLMLIGLIIFNGWNLISLKLLLLIMLIYICGPMVVLELGNQFVTRQTNEVDSDFDQ